LCPRALIQDNRREQGPCLDYIEDGGYYEQLFLAQHVTEEEKAKEGDAGSANARREHRITCKNTMTKDQKNCL